MTTTGNMGYVGWVQFKFPNALANANGNKGFIRATSCDLKATQAIDPQDVVDGTYDKTVYKLGPIEIGGSVSFPAVYELGAGGSSTAMANLWDAALIRDGSAGDFASQAFKTTVKYSNNTKIEYTDCAIDSYEWSVTQSDVVTVKVNLIGKGRNVLTPNNNVGSDDFSSYAQKNTRIITWNDVTIQAGAEISTAIIRSFTCTVNNNVKRYYSLNNTLYPELLTPTKRDITGKISLIGRSSAISGDVTGAEGNVQKCTADQTIGFRLNAVPGCSSGWGVQFPGMCIFEYEEIALTNELFETTVNYKVFPGETLGGVFSKNYVVYVV